MNLKTEEISMFRKTFVLFALLAVATSLAVATDLQPKANLTAAEIVDRNIQARGGLQNWRAVQSMVMSGMMEAGGNNRPVLPTATRRSLREVPPPRPAEQMNLLFVMKLKRPRMSRLEIEFKGQTAVQIFDGANGYKLRPFLNRREVEPYTAEEMKAVATQSELDGPLMDYAAKGTRVELAGTEKVEDRDTFKLKLILRNGEVVHVWIDAETFLETKISGVPRRLDGIYHPVEIYYRDYRSQGKIKIPYLLETKVLNVLSSPGSKTPGSLTEKIVLEKVEINSTLDNSVFGRTELEAEASNKGAVTPTSYAHP